MTVAVVIVDAPEQISMFINQIHDGLASDAVLSRGPVEVLIQSGGGER